MYVSRLSFQSLPGKADEVVQALEKLREMVKAAGGARPRILRTHFASIGAADVAFEQEVPDLAALESQLKRVNDHSEFREWRRQISALLWQAPKREIYLIAE
ncbi:MAG: hypothetical protein Q7R39_15530 [Dehalococcoidia bacterium]|nr:hypothetical protein [Dehalococcoidia bacterium]